MEFSQIALNQGLTFLTYTTAIILIVVAGFLVKLFIDTSKTMKYLQETLNIVNEELKPTLKGINDTLTIVNDIVKSTDKGFGDIKSALAKVVDKTKVISGTLFGGIIKGFVSAYKLFKK